MKVKNFLKTILAKVRQKKPKVDVPHAIRAGTYWKIMAISFLSAVFLIFVGNFLIYQNVSREEFLQDGQGTASTSASVSARLLNTTVNFFKTKSATFNQLRKTSAISVDPSL